MGQKIHPTGFRNGITQSHQSVWFSNYGSYRKVLHEDYKVRKLFETKFEFLYEKAGISKLKIERKSNEFVLLICAARPNIVLYELKSHSQGVINFQRLIKNIKNIVNTTKISVKILKADRNESSLVARSIATALEMRLPYRRVLRDVARRLENDVKGFKIQVAGRLGGAEIARVECCRSGRVPLHTLSADISYAAHQANTKYGVIGVKVWIFNKKIS